MIVNNRHTVVHFLPSIELPFFFDRFCMSLLKSGVYYFLFVVAKLASFEIFVCAIKNKH